MAFQDATPRFGEPWGPWREGGCSRVGFAHGSQGSSSRGVHSPSAPPGVGQQGSVQGRQQQHRGESKSLARLWEAWSQPGRAGLGKPGAHHLCGRRSIVRSTCFGVPVRVPHPVNKYQLYLTLKSLPWTPGQKNAAEKPRNDAIFSLHPLLMVWPKERGREPH